MMRSVALLMVGALAVGAALCVDPQTSAAQDASAAIAARKAVFQGNRDALRAIKPIVDAGAGYAAIVPHARKVAEAAAIVAGYFPAGSDQGDTKAKPDIWQNKADFEALFGQLQARAGELAVAAEGGDSARVQAAFAALGKACGTCHDKYRF